MQTAPASSARAVKRRYLPGSRLVHAHVAPHGCVKRGNLLFHPQDHPPGNYEDAYDGAHQLVGPKNGIETPEPKQVGCQRYGHEGDPSHDQDDAYSLFIHVCHLPSADNPVLLRRATRYPLRVRCRYRALAIIANEGTR